MKIGIDKNWSMAFKIRVIFRIIFSVILMITILFITAGRWDYWQGWVYFILVNYMNLFNFILIPSELVKERAKPNAGTKKWDLVIYIIVILMSYTTPFIAALDGWRIQWTDKFPLVVNILAFIVIFLGYSLFNYSLWINRFFSSTVRVQKDRGQYVIDKGPYAFIRHPGYAGLIIAFVAAGFALNSIWALIPAELLSWALIIRTFLEDKTLRKELPGYAEYAERVKYRLIPGIW